MRRSTLPSLAALVCFSSLAIVAVVPAFAKSPFHLDALMKVQRVADPQLSPDGKWVTFSVTRIDMEKNTRPTQIWIVPLNGGAAPRPLTTEGTNQRARWMPDSKRIAFVSTRGGSSQIWSMNPDGSDQKQLTRIATEASDVTVAPDGKHLIFTSEVYPDCTDEACNQRKLDEEAQSKVKARSYTSLLYRHWNQFQGLRRKHVFVVPAVGGAPRDLTPGPRDVPPFNLGGPDDFAVAPDGKEVVFAMNADPQPAVSTNSDLYVAPLEGGEARKITNGAGADLSPQYSPDGKFLAWRSQARAGFESDRWRLMVIERASGRVTALTENLDRSVGSFTWAPDSQRIFYTIEDRGRSTVQMLPVSGGGSRTIASGNSHIDDVQLTPDSKTMIYSEQSGSRPVELYRVSSSGGSPVALTRLNDALWDEYQTTPLEDFWVASTDGARVQSFVVKPPDFNPKQKYPVLFLIHGGPQGAWGESWTYRWNAQVFAAAGYLVVMPNPRGSTGYGQKFTDEISGDWGGKVYDDIMAAVDEVVKQPYADPDRMAAAGGSYGGYMVNWILGHSTRFKALISHAGVFDLRSMAGETEELWFPMWEFQGMPWNNPEIYAKWSPSYFVPDFKTPTLVIHGELDYRVPVGQGMQLFTALQLQKVPSKLLLFPDEGHWINKPQNARLWYRSFLDWIGEWTAKPK
jgi:dipeptidyl aminopeptidase/acylaminoacyl peptidase